MYVSFKTQVNVEPNQLLVGNKTKAFFCCVSIRNVYFMYR